MADLQEEKRLFEKLRKTPQFERFAERPVAYFCAEIGLEAERSQYAGGVGILAGDMIREAGDMKLPMVAVGLYYRQGFNCPTKEVGGQKMEVCPVVPPSQNGFEPVVGKDGKRLHITVPIHDRDIRARVWQTVVRGTPVYVMDTNCEENTPHDRSITDRLYVNDKEMRLKQEIVLGIGGLRLLEALNIHPSIYHLNEGHSAMLALELIHHEMHERNIGFDEAKQFARRRIIMTNHTLLPAGNEVFSGDLAAMLLQRYSMELAVPVQEMVNLGAVQQSSEFSLSMLAFRMSSIINAVSRLHAKKAKEIWHDHPMVPITNGVHVPTWDAVGDVEGKGAFWRKHQERKKALLEHIKKTTGRDWGPDEMLVGFARRIVRYKRPMAMFEDVGRFGGLARNINRPFRFVISGHPHPTDPDGGAMLERIQGLCDGEFRDVAVFLPDYDMKLAKLLVAGCDVWLNTPVVGFEACGTSGMKAALNGALALSTRDGWVDEADLREAGWYLRSDNVTQDIFDRLEQEVLPTYYTRDAEGVPEIWEEYMRNSRRMILDHFTSTRMLREYLETMYL